MNAQPRRLRPKVMAAGALLVVILGAVAIKYGRHHFLPKRFAEVEPGRLYRSGYCEPGPLTDVIRTHNVKTILTLLSNEPDSKDQQKEEAVARREGVTILRIAMPGDGRGEFAQLDSAADAMADASKQPMLVHCAAGVNRTGAAYVAYRLKYSGWTFEQAMAEAERYGYSPDSTPQLREHLRGYSEYLRRSATATQPVTATTSGPVSTR